MVVCVCAGWIVVRCVRTAFKWLEPLLMFILDSSRVVDVCGQPTQAGSPKSVLRVSATRTSAASTGITTSSTAVTSATSGLKPSRKSSKFVFFVFFAFVSVVNQLVAKPVKKGRSSKLR